MKKKPVKKCPLFTNKKMKPKGKSAKKKYDPSWVDRYEAYDAIFDDK